MTTLKLHHGDCLNVLDLMEENSVDAVVTDPPYELGFMGRSWDKSGVAFTPDTWRQVMRVLKPGGHMVAFGAPKNYHRLACAIEDAGFEVRDSLMWVFGQGFPKSQDVSKAIDKAGGINPREQAALLKKKRETAALSRDELAGIVGCTPSSIRDWEEGRARSSGAPVEWLVPSDNYRTKLADALGYSSDERRVVGASIDRRGDGTVYGVGHSGELRAGGNTDAAREWQGWGTALKPAYEPVVLARKPLSEGTVAANVLRWGTGAINVDATRIESCEELRRPSRGGNNGLCGSSTFKIREREVEDKPAGLGRWPANLAHDGSDEVLEGFPKAGTGNGKGAYSYAGKEYNNKDTSMFNGDKPQAPSNYNDNGSAARFFFEARFSDAEYREQIAAELLDISSEWDENDRERAAYARWFGSKLMRRAQSNSEPHSPRLFYCAKANKHDRAGSKHPTVKPVALMQWLVRMVTPPGGTVLDPFAGSGTTGQAAINEGFNPLLIEREAEYVQDIKNRFEGQCEVVVEKSE